MPPTALASATSGIVFGAALAASTVYSPQTIIAQMHLQDFHMLKVFLTASAASALVIPLFSYLGIANPRPPRPATIKHLPQYSANVVGGALIGAGMALTGACPGTVLVQIATGVPSGLLVFAGGVLGGILWSGVGFHYKDVEQTIDENPKASVSPPTSKVQARWPFFRDLLAYEIFCLTVVSLAVALGPDPAPAPINPYAGGVLIGAAQAYSLFSRSTTLGVSTAYEEAGHWFWQGLDSVKRKQSTRTTISNPSTKAMTFASGILAGSWTFVQLTPSYLFPVTIPRGGETEISMPVAVLGGCVMMFGARLAGGCTSGHGISGMSMLGLASTLSVGAMFICGMGLAAVMG